MTDLEIIREACIRANPGIRTRRPEISVLPKGNPSFTGSLYEPPIRLADIVETHIFAKIQRKTAEQVANWFSNLGTPIQIGTIALMWNKRTDDLSQQSPETLKFLAKLLSE